eukprot:TRINITY_DN9053_c0_g1_i2.p1 TRINITY_DN9053_c0_g1~~TRINITY_DN9053_c0_g1_i2.p1  ORF type:complete len:144 (-),score=15.91 TRINITY_DN9053_c0_g1_i2:38-469(-)
MGEHIEECYEMVAEDENCYRKCALKTEKKMSESLLWIAAYFSCNKCHSNWKQYNSTSPLYKKICGLIAEGCEKVVEHEENEQKQQELKEICEGLRSEDGQKKCMSDIDKNPTCFLTMTKVCCDNSFAEQYTCLLYTSPSPRDS